MNTKLFSATLLASFFVLASQAGAGNITFHYNARELSSPAGMDAVYSRIQKRADSFCQDHDLRALWCQRLEALCAAQLVGDIVAKIDHSGLSAAHAKAASVDRFASRAK